MSRTIVWRERNLAHVLSEVSKIVPDEQRPMQVSITKYRKSKSREQLGYLFGPVLGTIQKHIEDSTGDYYTVDDLYDWFVEKYGERKVVTVGGEPVVTHLRASRMKTDEMAHFIDRIIDHAAMHMGLAIPPPDRGEYEV